MWTLVLACKPTPPVSALAVEPLDAVIVPGCPTQDDGTLTGCLWQRAIWAAQLWEDGATGSFITSGSAVQNRYIEAEALRDGMVALGVPADRIHLETQALHTDENAAYGLEIARELGFERLGAASHGGQARGMRAMLAGWGADAVAIPMDLDRVVARMRQGLPMIAVDPVPASEWMPLDAREKLIAERRDEARRPPSWWVYSFGSLSGSLKRNPPVPPVTEPTLRGRRHRVDTRPWPDEHVATTTP